MSYRVCFCYREYVIKGKGWTDSWSDRGHVQGSEWWVVRGSVVW